MTRRARLRLLIVLVVLGVPAIGAGIVAWYLGSGRLESRIAYEYRRRLPGALTIGKVEIGGLGSAELQDVTLGPAGHPVIRARRVALRGDLAHGRPSAVRVEGLSADIDPAAVAWLRELAAQLDSDGGGAGVDHLSLEVDGDVRCAGGLAAEQLSLRADWRQATLQAQLAMCLAGEPFELVVDHQPADGGVRHVLELRHGAVRLMPLFHSLEAVVGMNNQDDVLEWLPAVADLSGTRLVLDPGSRDARGPLAVSWRGGGGQAHLSLSRTGLRLSAVQAQDRELGQASDGSLALDFAPVRLEVDVPVWTAGPRIPIPEKVPVRELFALLPAAHLVVLEEDDKPRLYLTLSPDASMRSTRHVEVRWRKTSPWRILATDLPVMLAEPWVPSALPLRDGHLRRLELTFDHRLSYLEAVGDAITVGDDGWSLDGLEPTLVITPGAVEDTLDAHITEAAFHVRYRGDGRGGAFTVAVADLGALAAHLHTGHALPDLSGRVDAELAWRTAEDGVEGELTTLTTRGVAIAGSLVGIDARTRGTFAWQSTSRRARIDGTLASGRARIAGRDIDLAERTPRFTATLGIEAGQLVLDDVLARAAGDDGFSVGMHGRLNAASLSGDIALAVDRADLGWLSEHGELVPLPKRSKLAGEMALTATARIADGAVERVDGWVLPLGADVSLADGEVAITGIKGAIAFRIAPPMPAEH